MRLILGEDRRSPNHIGIAFMGYVLTVLLNWLPRRGSPQKSTTRRSNCSDRLPPKITLSVAASTES